ncbi:chromosome partitioning protein ParA [Spirochaetia bacterium]|nr:chromosome partitioning protein ParA [Spirochaetia bacterium]
MAKKIFFGNYKGGVGKTTSAYQISLELVKKDKRVLLIDLDPQSSLSEICMQACGKHLDNLGRTETLNYLYVLYVQSKKINSRLTVDCTKIVKNTRMIKKIKEKLCFIPNNLFSEYGGLDKIGAEFDENIDVLPVLRNFIEENNLNDEYDFILFDCPPSNNVITQSAFLYSDFYIIPTIMDELSVRGVDHYISVVKNIYDAYCVKGEYSAVFSFLFGDEPRLIGIFETIKKGPTNTDVYRNQIKALYPNKLFDIEIKHLKEITDTTGHGRETHDDGYTQLTDEMLSRLAMLG